jgi:hypothetical protein
MSLEACSLVAPGPNLAVAWSNGPPTSAKELMEIAQTTTGKVLLTQGYVQRPEDVLAYGLPPLNLPTAKCPFTISACDGPYGVGIPTTGL